MPKRAEFVGFAGFRSAKADIHKVFSAAVYTQTGVHFQLEQC